MSIDELQSELDRVNAERTQLAAKAKAIATEIERARAAESVKDRVAAMSDAEREALRRELGTG